MSLEFDDFLCDKASIDDVFDSWAGEDDSDIDSVEFDPIFDNDIVADVVPASPIAESNMASEEDHELLERLVKKYPNFVPDSLQKMPRRRNRPVCMFINFMGTRKPLAPKPAPDAISLKRSITHEEKPKMPTPSPAPTPFPTDAPSLCSQNKKRRLTQPTVVTPTAKIAKITKIFDPSPVPTLAPIPRRTTITPPPQVEA